jgi:hypothetical protein
MARAATQAEPHAVSLKGKPVIHPSSLLQVKSRFRNN